jgi:hypothetical protein
MQLWLKIYSNAVKKTESFAFQYNCYIFKYLFPLVVTV